MDNEQRYYENGKTDLCEMLQNYIDYADWKNKRRHQAAQEDDNPGARILERGYEGEYPEF